jgi:nucleoside-diphosphate-sugar epimerase
VLALVQFLQKLWNSYLVNEGRIDMKTILITGVTGFVGSSLAANFLHQGHRVVALSRHDPEGERTKQAVKTACTGFSISHAAINWSNLVVVPIDYKRVNDLTQQPSLPSIDEAWHVAAEMTYSSKKFVGAFQQNLTATGELYEVLNDHAPNCRRFYYISTAYTGGFSKKVIEERIHTNPQLVNVYQASKWATETSLFIKGHEMRLPVTILRPSIVIGHEQTGWSGYNSFGMYSLIAAILTGVEQGAREITLDLKEAVKNNVIPINDLVENALKLSEKDALQEKVEIFNAVAVESLPLTTSLDIVSKILNIKISLGRPKTLFDRVIHSVGRHNLEFARTEWKFTNDRLMTVLGPEFKPTCMTYDKLFHIIAKFIEKRQAAHAPFKQAAFLKKLGLVAKIALHKFAQRRSKEAQETA